MQVIKKRLPSQAKNHYFEYFHLDCLFSFFKIGYFLKKAGISKEKGFQPFYLLLSFCGVIFKRSRSINEGLKLIPKTAKKSTLYDFLQNTKFDWSKLLGYVSKLYSNKFTHDKGKITVLSIDDTALEKSGKYVEHISKFYDHSKKKYFSGFQVVIAALCNLRTCIPIDFVLKSTTKPLKKKKTKGKQLSKNRAKKNTQTMNKSKQNRRRRSAKMKKSRETKRVQLSRLSKIKIAIRLIKNAIKHKIMFNYVLWDSWYNCSEAYEYVFNYLILKGIHLVSMVKLSTEKYKFLSKELNIKEIYKLAGAWQIMESNNIKYKSMIIEIISKSTKGRPVIGKVKLCFYRFPGHRKYKALISTNLKLTEEEILEIYTYRWSIEMVIRDLKQYFGFNQSNASKYQSLVADISIKFLLYIMVCALKEREPHKSTYVILFEMSEDFEDHCIETVNRYFFKNTIEVFIEYAESIGITDIYELKIKCKSIIDDFFNSEFYEDKIESEEEYYKKQKSA